MAYFLQGGGRPIEQERGESAVSTVSGGEGTTGRPDEPEGFEPDASTTERVADKAHSAIDGAAENAAEAERELRQAAAEAAARARRSEEQVAEAIDQNVARVREYIEQNPIQSAGIAFVAGVVLSSLLKR